MWNFPAYFSYIAVKYWAADVSRLLLPNDQRQIESTSRLKKDLNNKIMIFSSSFKFAKYIVHFCLLQDIFRLKIWPHLQHYPEREALVWVVFSENSVPKQFLSTVLLIKAPIENKQNTSKQVKFESSHVRIIHKHRTRDLRQKSSLLS